MVLAQSFWYVRADRAHSVSRHIRIYCDRIRNETVVLEGIYFYEMFHMIPALLSGFYF